MPLSMQMYGLAKIVTKNFDRKKSLYFIFFWFRNSVKKVAFIFLPCHPRKLRKNKLVLSVRTDKRKYQL
jgi:hypothetical protein